MSKQSEGVESILFDLDGLRDKWADMALVLEEAYGHSNPAAKVLRLAIRDVGQVAEDAKE